MSDTLWVPVRGLEPTHTCSFAHLYFPSWPLCRCACSSPRTAAGRGTHAAGLSEKCPVLPGATQPLSDPPAAALPQKSLQLRYPDDPWGTQRDILGSDSRINRKRSRSPSCLDQSYFPQDGTRASFLCKASCAARAAASRRCSTSVLMLWSLLARLQRHTAPECYLLLAPETCLGAPGSLCCLYPVRTEA